MTICCVSVSVGLWSRSSGSVLFIISCWSPPFKSSDFVVVSEVNSRCESISQQLGELFNFCFVQNENTSVYLFILERWCLVDSLCRRCNDIKIIHARFLPVSPTDIYRRGLSPVARQSIQPVSKLPLLVSIFYLQGCVFCVFARLCLIDSNMGFLNGLSSDLFPQELLTQNDFKDAWWECRSLRSEATAFVVIYPPLRP